MYRHCQQFNNVSVNNPKMVILLAYQRSGSTMLSQLFNANPDVFYQFEPLDAFYSARYGTAYGWNVPSDITNLVNGTLRSGFFHIYYYKTIIYSSIHSTSEVTRSSIKRYNLREG